jgi:hypothetical protein
MALEAKCVAFHHDHALRFLEKIPSQDDVHCERVSHLSFRAKHDPSDTHLNLGRPLQLQRIS